MKRLLIILALLLPLAAMSQSKLYERYASRPELTVAQVSGFKLGDTVRVDVVLLSADSPAAWAQLLKEMDLAPAEGVSSWLGTPDNPACRTRWTGGPALRVVASHDRRTLAFYIIENEQQYDALLDYQLNHMSRRGGKRK